MAYVQPNTDLILLQGVPLDSNKKHSIYWTTYAAQAEWFQGKAIPGARFTALSYARQSTGIVRVQVNPDNVLSCNYMMYRNTAFGTKWFYAFVKKVTYINNVTTEIEFEIDYLQSYMMELRLRPCMVERQHATVDRLGSSRTAEPVDTGPIVCHLVYDAVDIDDYVIAVAYAGSQGSDGGEEEG